MIERLIRFADSSLPASWLVHTLGAILLLPLIGSFPVVVFFVLRESEQYVHARRVGGGEPWYDYVFDVMGPLLVALAYEVLGWPNFSTWWFGTW